MRGDFEVPVRRALLRAATFLCFAGSTFAQGGSLSVLVVDSATQAPIAGVEVKASGQTSRTGGDGRARFEKLAPGQVFASAHREGYAAAATTDDTHVVQIKAGDTAPEMKISLTRLTSLEGRVLDEDGHPMPGVFVQASTLMWPSSSPEALSDREGRFRLEKLAAGRCRLDLRIPMEVRRKTLLRDAKAGTVLGYPAAEYYPGVADVSAAIPIPIASGLELHGYEIRLRRVPLADFAGRTLSRPEEPLTGVHVELQTPGSTPMLDDSLGSRPVDGEGRFRFELIPPGPYVLLVYRGENGSGLPHIQPVEVAKNGVTDKTILVPPFQAIRGILRVKEDAEWSGEVSIAFKTDQKGVTERGAIVRRSGEFVIENVPPGEWMVDLKTERDTARVSDKHRLRVAGARFGGIDPVSRPIQVVESGNPVLEIELSADTGRIAGRVEGSMSFITVERVDTPRRFSQMEMVRVNPDGTFVTDLAPGAYQLWAPPGKPVKVEVKAGDTVQVQFPGAR